MDDLYREQILEHYKRPRHWGELPDPDAEAEDNNPLCGDELKVQLKIEDGKVADVGFIGHGCAISQAAASMALRRRGLCPTSGIMFRPNPWSMACR